MDRRKTFEEILKVYGVGLAYFFGSQKELGPLLLEGDVGASKPGSDLDLGIVLQEHIIDYHKLTALRERLVAELGPLFVPIKLHLLFLEEENAHVQYAALQGIRVYMVSEEFERRYRRQALTLYGDWHSWWP